MTVVEVLNPFPHLFSLSLSLNTHTMTIGARNGFEGGAHDGGFRAVMKLLAHQPL